MLPTKRNLIITKKNLQLAKRGFDLMDKKYRKLQREYARQKNIVKLLLCQLKERLRHAEMLNKTAYDELGELQFNAIAHFLHDETQDMPSYNLWESTASLDDAFFAWREAREAQKKLTIAETAAKQVSIQMLKAKKRASALEHVTIPRLEASLKYTSDHLEERERDELTRARIAMLQNMSAATDAQ